MKTLDLKKEIKKLSEDFRIAAGDPVNGTNGQPVVPARTGKLEDIALRNIDMYRGKDPAETRAVFRLGKRIREAAETVQTSDAEFEPDKDIRRPDRARCRCLLFDG
jgi:hypothetical protein